jgi:hypothetical protein
VTLENGTISQQPFAYGASKGTSAIGSSWIVPVLTRSLKGGTTSRHLLASEAVPISDEAPVVLNAGGSGVFRSRYGTAELSALSSHIDELEELERATLLADGWASLFAGQITWDAFIAIAKGLGNQNEPNPWGTVATAFGYARRVLDGEELKKLTQSARETFGPQFERLGWDAVQGEDELTPQLRAIVIGALGITGNDESIRAEALIRFDNNALDGDIARTILSIVADQNRPGDYETFLDRYRNSNNPQEQQRYLWGLADFSDETIALDAAEKCFSEFRSQDAPIVLGILTRNAKTGPAVWKYMTKRWDEALEKFPPSSQSRLALGVPLFINDEAFADVVEKFHTSHPLVGEQRTVEQQLERMRVGLSFASALRQQF